MARKRTHAAEILNEAWECSMVSTPSPPVISCGLAKRTRFSFLTQVVESLQNMTGVLDGTMNRNAAPPSDAGRNLERADMTAASWTSVRPNCCN